MFSQRIMHSIPSIHLSASRLLSAWEKGHESVQQDCPSFTIRNTTYFTWFYYMFYSDLCSLSMPFHGILKLLRKKSVSCSFASGSLPLPEELRWWWWARSAWASSGGEGMYGETWALGPTKDLVTAAAWKCRTSKDAADCCSITDGVGEDFPRQSQGHEISRCVQQVPMFHRLHLRLRHHLDRFWD